MQRINTVHMLPIIFCLQGVFASAQEQPIKWTFEARRITVTEATVCFKASMGRGWHLYSLALAEGGPVKTSFTFGDSESFVLKGNVVEPKPIIKYDKYFDVNVGYFENAVVFQQEIKLNDELAIVNGTIRFMMCNEQVCLPPQTMEFSITVD